jgi:hypothetical protein
MMAQNGEIWCESEPDRGSVFSVRLKAASRSSRRRVGAKLAANA